MEKWWHYISFTIIKLQNSLFKKFLCLLWYEMYILIYRYIPPHFYYQNIHDFLWHNNMQQHKYIISYIITEKFKYNMDHSHLRGLWNFAHFDFGYNYCMRLQVYVLQTAKTEEGNRHAWSKSSQKSSCKTSTTTNAAAKHSELF